MQRTFSVLALSATILVGCSLFFLGCGGGGGSGGGGGGTTTPPVPPSFTSSPVTSATEQLSYSYAVSVSGSPTPTLTASGLPSWLSLSGNTLSGTPAPSDAGTTSSVTLTATNSAGSVDQTFQITVNALSTGVFDTATFEGIEFQ